MRAVEIERVLEERIRQGCYLEGGRLPTVRDLARELGVNKNTAVRAYQALERKGYLNLVRGRGAFVCRGEPIQADGDRQWRARLMDLLADARRRSLSREEVVHELLRGVDQAFGKGRLRVAFVDCNSQDVEVMGSEVSTAIGYPLEGILLSDLLSQPEEVAAHFDLIITTFYHLSAVSQALGPARDKVVGVLATLPHDALMDVARLHVPVIGLVCDLMDTSDNVAHIVRTYHPSATILPALIHDEARLQVLLDKADAIVVTRSCYARLARLRPRVQVITVTFTIDRQSIDVLRSRIQEQGIT